MPMFNPDRANINNKIRFLPNSTTNNQQQNVLKQRSNSSCIPSLSMLLTLSASQSTDALAINMEEEFIEPSPIANTKDALKPEIVERNLNFLHIGELHINIRGKSYPLSYADPRQKTHQSSSISVNGFKLPLECNGYRLCYDWLYRRVSLGHTEPTPLLWSEIYNNFVHVGEDTIYIRGKQYALTYTDPNQKAHQSCYIRVNDDLTLPVEYGEYRLCYDWLYRKISLGQTDPAPISGNIINEILNGSYEDSSPDDSNLSSPNPVESYPDENNSLNDNTQLSPNPVESYPDENNSLNDNTQLSPNPVENYPDENNSLSDSIPYSLSPVEGWLGENHLFANRNILPVKPGREKSVSENNSSPSLDYKAEMPTQANRLPLQDRQSNNGWVCMPRFRF